MGGKEGSSRQWRGVSPTNGAGRVLWHPAVRVFPAAHGRGDGLDQRDDDSA